MSVDKDKLDAIFLELDKGSTVGILLQRAPDPDCLGAAAGFATLLREVYGLSSKTFYHGEISHPQNKSMTNVLHIPLSEGADFDPESVDATVVLDTDLTSTGFLCEKLPKVDVRIDHHTMDRDEEPQYSDVRAVGSTCAMIWEYLTEYEVNMEEHADAATAMCLGIKTDTLDFTSASTTELDRKAFHDLSGHVNQEAMAKVMNFSLPKVLFETEAKAFAAKETRNTVLISYVGELIGKNRDIIPTIADRFARMEGVETVVIMGTVENHLIASVRSVDTRVNVSDLCTKVWGKEFAGAKEGSGGARLPLGQGLAYLTSEDTKNKALQEIVESVQTRIFEHLGE